jgi:hypothetical protein
MSKIDKPILFDTSEADAIESALEVFPPDNPWNLVIDDWPLHPDSKKIMESIGANKKLRYNTDMGYVLVPPDQKRVGTKLGSVSAESDTGPYPVPDNTPIEGYPLWPRLYESRCDVHSLGNAGVEGVGIANIIDSDQLSEHGLVGNLQCRLTVHQPDGAEAAPVHREHDGPRWQCRAGIVRSHVRV